MIFQPDVAVQAWLDQEDAFTADTIRRYGTCIQSVGGDERRRQPSFAYTVGLHGHRHPELLIFDVPPSVAGRILNSLSRQVQHEGRVLRPGEVVTVDGWAPRIRIEHVPNPADIAFAANGYYRMGAGRSVALLQLTHEGEDGLLPGDPGYTGYLWRQPRPGRFTAA